MLESVLRSGLSIHFDSSFKKSVDSFPTQSILTEAEMDVELQEIQNQMLYILFMDT